MFKFDKADDSFHAHPRRVVAVTPKLTVHNFTEGDINVFEDKEGVIRVVVFDKDSHKYGIPAGGISSGPKGERNEP